MTVWIYVDTGKRVGDEGAAFEYPVTKEAAN